MAGEEKKKGLFGRVAGALGFGASKPEAEAPGFEKSSERLIVIGNLVSEMPPSSLVVTAKKAWMEAKVRGLEARISLLEEQESRSEEDNTALAILSDGLGTYKIMLSTLNVLATSNNDMLSGYEAFIGEVATNNNQIEAWYSEKIKNIDKQFSKADFGEHADYFQRSLQQVRLEAMNKIKKATQPPSAVASAAAPGSEPPPVPSREGRASLSTAAAPDSDAARTSTTTQGAGRTGLGVPNELAAKLAERRVSGSEEPTLSTGSATPPKTEPPPIPPNRPTVPPPPPPPGSSFFGYQNRILAKRDDPSSSMEEKLKTYSSIRGEIAGDNSLSDEHKEQLGKTISLAEKVVNEASASVDTRPPMPTSAPPSHPPPPPPQAKSAAAPSSAQRSGGGVNLAEAAVPRAGHLKKATPATKASGQENQQPNEAPWQREMRVKRERQAAMKRGVQAERGQDDDAPDNTSKDTPAPK